VLIVRTGGELAIIFADTATRDLWAAGLTVLIDFAGMPTALAARRPRTVWLENLVVAAEMQRAFLKEKEGLQAWGAAQAAVYWFERRYLQRLGLVRTIANTADSAVHWLESLSTWR